MGETSPTNLKPTAHHISVSGRFPPGWAGDFAQSLAAHGFSIVSGLACRNLRGFWAAEFDVLASTGCPALSPPEIERLATTPVTRPALPPIHLHRYSLVRPIGSPMLTLDVEAPDQRAFLAQLLSRLAFLSLFPVEMRIETTRGFAHDRLHLRGIAGHEPLDQTLAAVRTELDRLLIKTEPTTIHRS
jgi:hypothetical protein